MLKKLRRQKPIYYYYREGRKIYSAPLDISGNLTGISGDLTGISGYLSGISGDLTGISGYLTGISGNLTGISGDLTDISGDINDCQITDEERKAGINIEDLMEKK